MTQFPHEKSMVIGTLTFNSKNLEEKRENKETINVKVIGMLILANDIQPSLALDTIQSITVRGVFKAPEDVKEALR